MAIGRVKQGPQGLYYDPNDSGPDQGNSADIDAFRAAMAGPKDSGSESSNGATADPVTGGVTGTAGATNVNSPVRYNREEFRDKWMATGTDVNQQNALLAQYGLKADEAGRVQLPKDVNGHSAETLDLRIGAKAGRNQAGWTDIGLNGNSNGPARNGVRTGGGDPVDGLGSVTGTKSSLMNYLMGRINQPLTPDMDDPIIRKQTDAYDAQQQKARRDFLGDFAEQNGSYNTGAMTGQARMTAEAVGKNVGAFQGQLMQRELESRRQEIQNALNGALGMISREDEIALTRELAQIQNALAYAQLSQSAYQFDVNDEFRRSPLAT